MIKTFAGILVLLCLSACGQKSESPMATRESMAATPAAADVSTAQEPPKTPRRYIALRHALLIETSASSLQTSFEATVKKCEQLQCQMLSASFNRETPFQPPSASLAVRVFPAVLDKFLSELNQRGEVLQHRRESEDKTTAVVDAEAKIKNLTELRDRLRNMLASRAGSIKDVIEVEQALAKTQAELDAIAGVRAALANETDMVAVEINFQARNTIADKGFFSPVAAAWSNAGHVLTASVGNLITFVAAVLPWLIIIVPVFLLLQRAWRKRRAIKA